MATVDTAPKTSADEIAVADEIAKRLYDSPKELESVLYAMTQPDNDNLRRATLTLATFLEEPRSITHLTQQLETSEKAEVRQVAAIYIRESIEDNWKKIPTEIQTKLQSFLLERLVTPEIPAGERIAIAAAITSISKKIMRKGEWPELLAQLAKGSAADAPTPLREACLTIWRNLLTFCGGSLKKHFPRILELIKYGLAEKDSTKVQIESVKCVGAMVEHLSSQSEVDIVEACIPEMVAVIESCMRRGEEDAVCNGMEVFSDMMESAVPIFNRHGQRCTEFMLKVAAAKELPLPVRKQSVNFMTFMCKAKPKMVAKNKLIQPFLSLSIALIIESDEIEKDFTKTPEESAAEAEKKAESDDLKDDTDFLTPLAIACDLLDEMYLNLPSESVFPLTVTAVDALLKAKADSDFKKRKAAYVIIAMMAEGCAIHISRGDNATIMIKACLNGLNDKAPPVRKCALEALSQLATHVNEQVIVHHEKILGRIFELFKRDDEDVRVKERALGTIEMFLDCYDNFMAKFGVEFPIKDYLKPLMGVIGVCLKSKNKALQIQAVATLASTAACAKELFARFVDQVLELLEKLLNIRDPDLVELRAEATACLGAVAQAAGKEKYGPLLVKYHGYVMEGLENMLTTSLSESSFMYFSDLSELMGSAMSELESFPAMVSFCLSAMADDDGLVMCMDDDGFGDAVPRGFAAAQERIEEAFQGADGVPDMTEMTEEELQAYIEKHALETVDLEDLEEADFEDDDEDDMLRNLRLQVTTGFMEEKAAAIHALQCMVRNCGLPSMAEYLEDIWIQVEYLWEYPNTVVKLALAQLMRSALQLVVNDWLDKCAERDSSLVVGSDDDDSDVRRFNWTPGQTEYEYTDKLADWLNTRVVPMYVQAMIDESDKDVLCALLSNFSDQLNVVGPKAVEPIMTELVKTIVLFYKEKTACFTNTQVDDGEFAEVAGRHKFVTDNMAELCGTLAHVWGLRFIPAFDQIFPALLRFAKPSRHPHDHAMCVGCVADIASRYAVQGERPMSKFAEKVYPIALSVAQSVDDNAKQNGLYCIGALSLATENEVNAKFLSTVLRCLNTYIKIDTSAPREKQLVRDNAVSALGKVIISQAGSDAFSADMFEELFGAFLAGIPMTADFSENEWVYRTICSLLKDGAEPAKKRLPRCLELLADALGSVKVPGSAKRSIATALRSLCEDGAVRSLIDTQLNEKQRDAVRGAVAAAASS